MSPPLVTVVIPAFNHRDYILATLASVFSQTFADYEVVVVNDGSPDDTAEVLRPLAEAGRIRYLEQPNRGEGAARNRGLAEARSPYVAFLDDDDLWPPDKLAWQVRVLNDAPDAVLVYGLHRWFAAEHELWADVAPGRAAPPEPPPSGWVHEGFLRRAWIHSPGQTLIRRATLIRAGGFDESIRLAGDYDLYLRLSLHGQFVHENRPALFSRRHPTNSSKDRWAQYRSIAAVRRKHLGRVPHWPRARLWLANYNHFRRTFYFILASEASQAWARGDARRTRTLWVRACRVNPLALGRMSVLTSLAKATFPRLYARYRRVVSPGTRGT